MTTWSRSWSRTPGRNGQEVQEGEEEEVMAPTQLRSFAARIIRPRPDRIIALIALIALGPAVLAQGATVPGPAGSTWSHPPPEGISTLVGTGKAVCSPKKCRYTVTCVTGTDQGPCGFILSITKQHALVTRPSLNGADFYPWPAAYPVLVGAGQTTNLTLRTIPPWKAKIKRLLLKGKRTLRGEWEANRLGILYQFGDRITIKLVK
jgi:hypothetical protein